MPEENLDGANGNAPLEHTSTVTEQDLASLGEATPAPGEHGATHVIVPNEHVSVLRRALQDVKLGAEGAWDRFEAAFTRVF